MNVTEPAAALQHDPADMRFVRRCLLVDYIAGYHLCNGRRLWASAFHIQLEIERLLDNLGGLAAAW